MFYLAATRLLACVQNALPVGTAWEQGQPPICPEDEGFKKLWKSGANHEAQVAYHGPPHAFRCPRVPSGKLASAELLTVPKWNCSDALKADSWCCEWMSCWSCQELCHWGFLLPGSARVYPVRATAVTRSESVLKVEHQGSWADAQGKGTCRGNPHPIPGQYGDSILAVILKRCNFALAASTTLFFKAWSTCVNRRGTGWWWWCVSVHVCVCVHWQGYVEGVWVRNVHSWAPYQTHWTIIYGCRGLNLHSNQAPWLLCTAES